jgi:hypothetical protein
MASMMLSLMHSSGFIIIVYTKNSIWIITYTTVVKLVGVDFAKITHEIVNILLKIIIYMNNLPPFVSFHPLKNSLNFDVFISKSGLKDCCQMEKKNNEQIIVAMIIKIANTSDIILSISFIFVL